MMIGMQPVFAVSRWVVRIGGVLLLLSGLLFWTGDAPRAMPKDEAVVVIRTCETVCRKNMKYSRSRDAEKTAEGLEGTAPAAANTPETAPKD